MTRTFAQHSDNEKKENVLQVAKWISKHNKKMSLRFEVGFPSSDISISIQKSMKDNLFQIGR